jgi:hypothetical protein
MSTTTVIPGPQVLPPYDETARWCAALETDGYVRLPAAIPPALLARLTDDVASVHDEEVAAGRVAAGEPLHLLGFAARRASFLELLDLPPVFPVVCRLLGWNLHVYHSHLDVHPPADPRSGPAWGWHQDGGRLNLDLETDPRPRISLKVAYWLTDLSEPGRGNIQVLPGSHLDNRLARPSEGGSSTPPGAVELLARAGDAVVFDRRLWHSRTVNRSTRTRRALFLAYAPRWLRPRDDHGLDRLTDDAPGLTPVRRQLLGAAGGPMDHWGLGDATVPLREHLAEAGALDATVPAHR